MVQREKREITVSAKIPESLHEEVEKISYKLDRSISWLIFRSLEEMAKSNITDGITPQSLNFN